MNIQDIEKRNRRLKSFFYAKKINAKIIGDIHKPAVIANDDTCLSCFCQNFDLIFTDKPFGGKQLFVIKLTDRIIDDYNYQFNDWYEHAQHRKVYRIIARVNTDGLGNLYLSGFQKNEDAKLSPVFCEHNPKIYFTEQKALDIAHRFSTENITLMVV